MRNLAYIETFDRFGSGILFPCIYGAKNSCIIITNYHVIRDLETGGKNVKEDINLEFYDKFGRKVEKEFINAVYAEYISVCDKESDVAALLVVLNDAISLFDDEEIDINWGEIDEGMVSSLGYPNVLQDDEVNHRHLIEGKLESTFPVMKKLGIYKIVDNYHYYEEFSDKDLLEGFSGGPVYAYIDGKKNLIGMNQSVSNVGEGSNPFKLVYFIRIRQVLEVLREGGIILFEYNSGKIEIEWIKRKEKKGEKSLDILLLGSSGAGKSSFAKELALHGDILDAGGDGQTTRMDIYYDLKLCCDVSKIHIQFFNKENFKDVMQERTKLNWIEHIFQNIYSFPHMNLEEDMIAYLKILFQPMGMIKENHIFPELALKEDVEKCIYGINEVIRKGDEADREEIIDLYEEIIRVLNKVCNTDVVLTPRKISVLCRMDWQECYTKEMCHENMFYKKEGITFEEYYNYVMEMNEEQIEKYCKKARYNQNIFEVLNIVEGYFDIKEFYYLFPNEAPQEQIQQIVDRYDWSIETVDININDDKEEGEKSKKLKEYYGELYDFIFERIRKHYNANIGNTITLKDSSEEEREFINMCLKVINGRSLTGLVKDIQIRDTLSNKYALMMHRCHIEGIKLIDTCGLDHIERGTGIKRYLAKKFLDYSENRINFNAIFYIKKLDAGKPTELERILPIIYSNISTCPIFTVFTGADFFYAGQEEILLNYEWNRQLYDLEMQSGKQYMPRSAKYIYKNDAIVKRMSCSDERKRIIYKVMRENLMPFISGTDVYTKYTFVNSNRRYLEKILRAILIDEWNFGYVDKKAIQETLNEPKFIEALDADIIKMFGEASLFDWKYRHHMTVNANVKRIAGKANNDRQMGYNGVFLDRWDVRFREGFHKAFLEGNSRVVEVLAEMGISENNLESMFGKLKNKIVAEDIKFREMNTVNEKESEFRKTLKKMYQNENYYKYNPYNDKEDLNLEQQVEKREYLQEVCNFQSGLKNEEIKNAFRNIFINEIQMYLKKENEKRIQNLLVHKLGFGKMVREVICEMKNFAGINNDQWMREIFDIFLEEGKKSEY